MGWAQACQLQSWAFQYCSCSLVTKSCAEFYTANNTVHSPQERKKIKYGKNGRERMEKQKRNSKDNNTSYNLAHFVQPLVCKSDHVTHTPPPYQKSSVAPSITSNTGQEKVQHTLLHIDGTN